MELNSLGKDLLTLILYYSCDKKSIISFYESSVSLSLVCREWLRVIRGDKFKFFSVNELNFILSGKYPFRVKRNCYYNFIWRDYVGKYSFPSGSLTLELSCEVRNEVYKFQNVPAAVELRDYLVIYNNEFLTVYYKTISNVICKVGIDTFQMGSHNSIGTLLEVNGGFVTFVFRPIYPLGTYSVSKMNLRTFEIQQKLLNIRISECGYFGVYYNKDGCLMRTSWEQMFTSTLDGADTWKSLGKRIANERYWYIFPCLNVDVIIGSAHIYAVGAEEGILWSLPLIASNAEYRAKRYGEILYISCIDQFTVLIDPQSGKIICTSASVYLNNIVSVTLDLDMLGYTLHLR